MPLVNSPVTPAQTLGTYGPTDAASGGSTWQGALGTSASAAVSVPGVSGYSDALTITVPSTGLYLCVASLNMTTAAVTGGGTYTIVPAVSFTTANSLRITRGTFTANYSGAATVADAKYDDSTVGRGNWLCAVLALKASTIVLELNHVIQNADASAGQYKVSFTITKL